MGKVVVPRSRVPLIIIQPPLTASNLPTESQRNNVLPTGGKFPRLTFHSGGKSLSLSEPREEGKPGEEISAFSGSRNFGRREKSAPSFRHPCDTGIINIFALVFRVIFKISRGSKAKKGGGKNGGEETGLKSWRRKGGRIKNRHRSLRGSVFGRSGCGFLDGKLRSPERTAVKYNCLK